MAFRMRACAFCGGSGAVKVVSGLAASGSLSSGRMVCTLANESADCHVWVTAIGGKDEKRQRIGLPVRAPVTASTTQEHSAGYNGRSMVELQKLDHALRRTEK